MEQEDKDRVINLIKTTWKAEIDFNETHISGTLPDGYWFTFPWNDVKDINKGALGKLLFEFKVGK